MMLLGDILRCADDAVNFPGRVVNGKGPIVDPPQRAVRADDPISFIILSMELFGESLANALLVIGMDGLHPGAWCLVEALARPAPNRFESRTDIEHLIFFGVGDPKDFVDVLGQLAEAFLTCAQR